MKKIYINEGFLSNVVKGRLLPQFLFKLVKTHTTSLGDNEAFPTSDEYPFDYVLLKNRYNEVCESIEQLNLESLDEDYLMSELSSLVTECKELEMPIRDSLEKICENAVNRLFAIPQESINMTFKLVDKIKFKNAVRMRPESNDDVKYTFKDIADIDLSSKAISKRRFIDALIQGASYLYSNVEGLYIDDIDKINPRLPRLYRKIRIINDYLLFVKKEEMSDDKPMQGSYVETHLGVDDTRTTIKAQGIIFPLLLHEAIKGLFELFSSHGLPHDRAKAEYVVKKADFVLAEPWDLRLGVGLWKMIFGNVEDTNMIPYMFTSFVKMPTDEFNISAKEILSNTEKGNEIVNSLMKNAEYDNGYQQFTNRINARNVDKSLIQDSYFTGAETNGYEIDSEKEEGVIEEDGEVDQYEELLANATVDNIDFVEGDEDEYGEVVYLTINGTVIPREIVNLYFRPIYKRFPTGKQQLLNIDIELSERTRGHGLGTKIYAKAVYEFGAICSRFSTRHNDNGIRGIFSKLSSFGDIYATEDVYENFEGETISDYYAILKSQLPQYIGESIKRKKSLLTESWSKTKKTIVRRTIEIIKNALPWASTADAQKYENEILENYFHGRRASNELFRPLEQVIAKILVEELGYPKNPLNGDKVYELKQIFDYIYLEANNDIAPDINYGFDNKANAFRCDDFNTIVAKYGERVKEYQERIKKKAANGTNSGYIVREVKTFEEAHEYTPYLTSRIPLCFTTHDYQWENFTKRGKNTAYVCLKNGWDRWRQGEEVKGENYPYDEYGLSMFWVFVDEEGRLTNCCIRWNHNGEEKMKNFNYGGFDADNALSSSAIEAILGLPFNVTFVSRKGNEFKAATQDILNRLASGENGNNFLEQYKNDAFNDHLYGIKVKGKYNFYNSKTNEITIPDYWFDGYDKFKVEGRDIAAIVEAKGSSNIIDNDGKLIFPENMWFENIYPIRGNLLKIGINGKWNVFDMDYNPFLDEWAASIYGYGNGSHYIVTFSNGKCYAAIDGNFNNLYDLKDIVNEHLRYGGVSDYPNYTNDFFELLGGKIGENGIVNVCDFYNVVGEDGRLLSPTFFEHITVFRDDDNFYLCGISHNGWDRLNLLSKNGNILIKGDIDEWPVRINLSTNGGYFECFYHFGMDSRYNFVDYNGNLFFKNEFTKWPNEMTSFSYGSERYYRVGINGKWNILNSKLEFIWKEPIEKWFDATESYFDLSYMKVIVGDKSNYISIDGHLADNSPVENWPRTISMKNINEEMYFIEYRNGIGYNVLFVDGSKLFDDNDGCYDVVNLTNSVIMFMKNENGPFNIYDVKKKQFVSEQWFDVYEECDNTDYVKLYIGNNQFIYDINKQELINLSSIRNERLMTFNPNENEDDKKIFEIVPNKLYIIKERDYPSESCDKIGNSYLCNIIVNKGDHYEYLFDKWYYAISRPLGNMICLLKSRKGLYLKDIYDISTNSIIIKDIIVNDIDRENNLIFISDNKYPQHENAVTPYGEILFDKWPVTIAYYGKKYLRVCYAPNKTAQNIFDLETHKFIANDTYKEMHLLSGTSDVFVAERSERYDFNIIGKNGEPLFDEWYTAIVLANENDKYALVANTNEVNFRNIITGEKLSDTQLIYINGVSLISKNGKYNYIGIENFGTENSKVNANLLLGDNWADNATAIDDRGYTKVTYGNSTFIYQAVNGQLHPVEQEGNASIPFDFTECNSNKINLYDHTLIYKLVGYREGRSEHTTTYTQKVTVVTSDGRKLEKMYTQRGDEPCKWKMYEIYESLCKQLGVKPASMD